MFVFISYCQHNPEVSGKVSRLAEYLMNEQGIDIQYDKGGLPVSTHIPTFQEKLCSPDCECVLVVCDKEYLNRSRQPGKTGVAQEYKFISTGVAKRQRTYIPLRYEDCELPACFSGDVYLDFGKSGNQREQFIEVFNAIISKNPEIKSTKKNDTLSLIGRYNRAKKETEKKDFDAAYVDLCAVIANPSFPDLNNKEQAKILNLQLITYHELKNHGISKDEGNWRNTVAFQLKVMEGYTEDEKAAVYWHNCALNQYLLKDYEGSLKSSEEALRLAVRYDIEDIHEFFHHYSVALYSMKRYREATDYCNIALSRFLAVYPEKAYKSRSQEQHFFYIYVLANLVEYQLELVNICTRKGEKQDIAASIEEKTLSLLNYSSKIQALPDRHKHGIYHVANLAYSYLESYY